MKVRRTILKQELAVKLYPDSNNSESAMQLLRKEIRNTKKLSDRLYGVLAKSNTHYFTHKQLEVILEHYSITPEEFELL